MKNMWIRIRENKNYSAKFIWSLVALSVIVVMTLPVCVAASMSFYKADDFIECISDIDRNFRELLLFSLNRSKDAYFHWMGTYFSKFVLAHETAFIHIAVDAVDAPFGSVLP